MELDKASIVWNTDDFGAAVDGKAIKINIIRAHEKIRHRLPDGSACD